MGLRDYADLLFLALVWSSSFWVIKVAVASIPPITMTAARMAVAAAALLLVLRLRGATVGASVRTWGIAAVVGLMGNALPFALIAWGEQSVDSGLAAILMGAMPVTTALLAHVLFHDEPLTARRALGVSAGFCGIATLVGWDALGGLGEQALAQLAVLGGGVCYALTTLFVRRFAADQPDLPLAAGASLAGAVVVAPVALLEQPWSVTPTPQGLAAVLALGLFATALASLVYFGLVRRVGAGNFAQVNYLIPGLGVLWGMLLLGESPRPVAWVALALILAGIWLVTGGPRRPGATTTGPPTRPPGCPR
jgi:drug/metabolite transporter (DMT)-like permease